MTKANAFRILLCCSANIHFRQTGVWLTEPPLEERMDVLRRQAFLACEHKGERVAMREMRKHAAYYMKGLRGAARLRAFCSTLETRDDLERLIERVQKITEE